jgi:hypothetical protein
MKPTKHKDLEKEYKAVVRERDKVRGLIYDLGYTKLDIPLRHGWYYEMVLDPALEDNPKYKEAYEYVMGQDPYIWGKDKKSALESFAKSNSNVDFKNHFLLVGQKDFNRFPDKMHSLCNIHIYSVEEYGKKKKVQCFKLKIPSNYITFKYKKAFVTHRKNLDPTLESRLTELQNLLISAKLYNHHSIGSGSWQDDNKDFKLDRKRSKIQLGSFLRKQSLKSYNKQ